jgi:hypothetical protein
MPRKQPDLLVGTLDKLLRRVGFQRQTKTWRLELAETIHLVELDKSKWGGQYQVILGVFLRKLGTNCSPKSCECHITQSLELLLGNGSSAGRWADEHGEPVSEEEIPYEVRQLAQKADRPLDLGTLDEENLNWILQHRPLLSRALDLEDMSLSDDRRKAIVEKAMLDKGLPFLKKYETEKEICSALRAGHLTGVAVWKLVYELCGLQPP